MLTNFRNAVAPSTTRRRPMSMAAPLVALALLLGLSACMGADQIGTLGLVRHDRAAHNVRSISLDTAYAAQAQAHAQAMANGGRLYHSPLHLAPGECSKGENVGEAGTVTQVEHLFMNSPPHRANILNPQYDHVAIGVVRQGGRAWVVQLFIGSC